MIIVIIKSGVRYVTYLTNQESLELAVEEAEKVGWFKPDRDQVVAVGFANQSGWPLIPVTTNKVQLGNAADLYLP